MKIFINPGHMPGVDSGAVNPVSGLRECDVAKKVGELVEYYLQSAGCSTMLLQSNNLCGEEPKDFNICASANAWQADLFVSLHCNSFNTYARGIETLVFDLSSKAARLAGCIQRQLVSTAQNIDSTVIDRGWKQRNDLAVLKYTDMPAVLVEMGFIDNDFDVVLLENNQDDLARAIARGVTDYMRGDK